MTVSKLLKFTVLSGVVLMTAACGHPRKPTGEDYWQRVEAQSALYLTGPKAQQQLEQNIAECVAVIKELAEMEATREIVPPEANQHKDYLAATKKDDELAYWETPGRMGALMVDHSDFHDFEGCMRDKGWERVNYVRPEAKRHARGTYKTTRLIRKYGPEYDTEIAKEEQARKTGYSNLNK